MRISLCTDIPASPAAVWSSIEDVRMHTAWMTDAERITLVGDQEHGVGTRFQCLTVVGPLKTTDVMTITEWDPAAVMGIEHRGAVTGRGRFTLAAIPAGTHFCWHEELRFPWWLGGPVGEAVARPVLVSLWRRNLDRLRAYVSRVSDR